MGSGKRERIGSGNIYKEIRVIVGELPRQRLT
jgi:hypothetical protein